ncbi:MAG: DnaD domain protein [Saccharofermentanales bacterium]|jgi:DnaD/phage-associated family protein
MQINESKKLLLSDTLVPDIFITEHLPVLSGLAVKLYISMLLVARTDRSINEQDLARRLGTDEENIRATLLELAARDLVQIRNRGVEILDIKAAEIQRIYRPKTASTPTEIIESQQKFDVREKLLADIAKTFFQGLMSPSWYGEIDSWFDRYKFEPEVIYALFQECARRNKLDSKAYISKVAENWSARGIITFSDLNAYFLSHERISKTAKKVGRKLRRQMTEYDEEIVARWVEQFNYDFDIIDLALRKTTRLSNPNLEVIDRILTEWFSHQLQDAAAVKAYESKKAARFGKSGASVKGENKAGNIGNFQQRNYTEDFLNEFYEDVTAGHTPPVENQSQQLEFSDLGNNPEIRSASSSGEKERLL